MKQNIWTAILIGSIILTTNYSFLLKSPERSSEGCEALLLAVNGEQLSTVKSLLITTTPDCSCQGVEASQSPLVMASRSGHLAIATALIENGGSPDYHLYKEESPLIAAASQGNQEVAFYLIKQGADVNDEVEGVGTPLIAAVRNGHYKMAKLLLDNGADPTLASAQNGYPMYHAGQQKDEAMMKLLLMYLK